MLFTLFIAIGFSGDIWQRMQSPMVAAHRGGMLHESYNTLERFSAAIKENVDILEMDLRISADGVPVVFHDEDLNRKTTCKGLLADLPWEKIKTCKYKGSKHKIPSFAEVLKVVNGKVLINAEFKTIQTVIPSIRLVQQQDAYAWVYFQVNSDLGKYHEARSFDTQVALLYKPRSEQELRWLENSNDPQIVVAQMDKEFINKERIARVHALGKFVSVNSWKWGGFDEQFKSNCKKLYQQGIDITVTNNNVDCVKVRDALRSKP